MASHINFKWIKATDIDYYQLFEDDVLVADNIMEPTFSLLMAGISQGLHQYQVRGVNQFGEGPLSDPVAINFILPAKITGLEYTLV